MPESSHSAAEEARPAAYLLTGIEALPAEDFDRVRNLLAHAADIGGVTIRPLTSGDLESLPEAEPKSCYISLAQFREGNEATMPAPRQLVAIWNALVRANAPESKSPYWSPHVPGVLELFHFGGLDAARAILNLTSLYERIQMILDDHLREGASAVIDQFPRHIGIRGIIHLTDLINLHLQPEEPLRIPGRILLLRDTLESGATAAQAQAKPAVAHEVSTGRDLDFDHTIEQGPFFELLVVDGRPSSVVTMASLRNFAHSRAGRKGQENHFISFFATLDRHLARQEDREPTAHPATLALSPVVFARAIRELNQTSMYDDKNSIEIMTAALLYVAEIESYLKMNAAQATLEEQKRLDSSDVSE